jgi:bifunctional DNA-binding transcriptional regulator/antitoxin component of YhaV-PrlF toxin-antitoxin module
MGKSSLTKPAPIDSRHRIVLPEEVMRGLGLDVGDHVSFEVLAKERSAKMVKVKVSWDPIT